MKPMTREESWRAFYRDMAAALEAGEVILSPASRKAIAKALRFAANEMPIGPRPKVGTPVKKIDGFRVALLHRARVLDGEKTTKVKDALAEEFGVTVEAIRDAIKRNRNEVEKYLS